MTVPLETKLKRIEETLISQKEKCAKLVNSPIATTAESKAAAIAKAKNEIDNTKKKYKECKKEIKEAAKKKK